jgi:diguanylate cyclase (GGDEF)-like protein/PAS domain S-box-containing protein
MISWGERTPFSLQGPERQQLQKELTETAYEHLPVSVLGIVVNALVLTYALWNLIDNRLVTFWLLLVGIISIGRLGTMFAFRRHPERRTSQQWERLFFVGLILSSIVWGGAVPFFFLSESPLHQAILLIIYGGLSAGAISSLASQLRAVQFYLLITLLPLLAVLLLQNSALHYTLALLVLLFITSLMIVAKRHYNNLYSSLERGILVQKAQEQLNLSEERFATIFQEAPVGIFFYDHSLNIIECNQEFSSIIQAPLNQIIGLDLNTIPDTRIMPALQAVLDDMEGHYEGEYHTKLSGHDIWVTLRTTPVRDAGRNLIGGIGIVSDITERMLAQRKIHQQAYYDSLTGIANRALLIERLQQEISRYRRHHNIVALLFLDLDHFKKINDSLGHFIGDELLKQTALRLRSILREEDLVARLGGDEFVILLTDMGSDLQHATARAETIAEKVHSVFETDFEIRGHRINTSTSIGIALTDKENETPAALLKHADTAMYQAKKEGRGTTSFYQAEMDRWIKQRLQLEQDLRSAIDADALELYYQPVVGFETRQVIGAEALLRWNHPVHGFINPEEIVSLAEETGLIVPLGHWVFETACRQLRSWEDAPDASHPLQKLTVNVSTREFNCEDYVDTVLSTLSRYAIDPSRITLELTESIIIDRLEDTVEKMTQLRRHGIGIAIDDFGTGYSSLSYLKKLPFSALKIDRSFTLDLLYDADDATLIETIIAIAKKFDLYVIAEGVETYEQYAFLAKHDCDSFQGYLCSRPLPPERFMELRQTYHGTCKNIAETVN